MSQLHGTRSIDEHHPGGPGGEQLQSADVPSPEKSNVDSKNQSDKSPVDRVIVHSISGPLADAVPLGATAERQPEGPPVQLVASHGH